MSPNAAPRPRVLHIGKYYPPHPGGIETHLQSMCESLTPWFDCEVVVSSESSRTSVEMIDGIRVTRLGRWLELSGAPICPAMPRAIAKARADLVHMQWPNPGAFAAYLMSGYDGPLIVSWQSDVVRQRILGRFFEPITRMVLQRADRIIVSSPAYGATSPILKDFAPRLRVIPNGIAAERFQTVDSPAVAQLREKFGERIVLAVGRLVYYKGFKFLVRAAKTIDGIVLVVGSGPLQTRLKNEARELGVEDKVHFLGTVANLAPFYHACKVFVLPSVARSEAFGIVQLEAMACGKPIVNTQLDSGVTFVSPNGVSGITVPPADSEALASAVNRLLNDAALREQYGRGGLRRVQEEFSLARLAIQLRDVYLEVLKDQPRTCGADSPSLDLTRPGQS